MSTTSPISPAEDTPLLHQQRVGAEPDRLPFKPSVYGEGDVYDRFSPARKIAIISMVSGCGLLPFFVTGTFTPSIPKIAQDLHSTGAIVNLAVSLSVLAASLGGLIGASYSTFYGRRPIYLCALPVLSLSSFGVASANSIPSLLIWRFLQSVGCSPALVIGAGVIGDIYRLEQRGRAMGMFFAACLIGPAIAPFIGGSVTEYFSWRKMQSAIGVAAIVVFVLFFLLFPETCQPGTRGIDKLHALSARMTSESDPDSDSNARTKTLVPKFVWINPFTPVGLLRSPPLFLIAVATTASLFSCFVLLIPLAYTIGERYQLGNSSLVGACFLPSGLGNIVGALLVGRLSDRIVVEKREEREKALMRHSVSSSFPASSRKPTASGASTPASTSSAETIVPLGTTGTWCPEDRLIASLSGYGILVPCALIGFALVNRYVDGMPGLVASELFIFLHGVGADISFGPCAAYLIDVMHSRSAESLAANNSLRSILIALGTSLILPMIDTFGIIATNVFAAVLSFASWGVVIYLIKNGDRLRAMRDVGFSRSINQS